MFTNRLSAYATICLVLLVALSTVVSCRKDDDDDIVTEPEKTGYAEDQLILEHVYNNVDRVVERAFALGAAALKGGENSLASCATVTNADGLMVIDFGSNQCLGYDGRYRKGKIMVQYTNDKQRNDKGYFQNITFQGYEVDGFGVMGTKRITNMGLDAAGNIFFDERRVDSVYKPSENGYITGESKRISTWYTGANTPQAADDAFRLSGTGSFHRPNGDGYNIEISEQLLVAINCNWITDGRINIYPEGATQRVLDYGDGGCENDATINVNGVVTPVKIP
ncbi:MAG: hypothetical protein H6551_00945 [Chitinophagales bacterium]|nr:hypothetical protein [Chitinophagaceae bacterium]MCB9063690.1 hypothetical protein [Chitinophagales bacterium]